MKKHILCLFVCLGLVETLSAQERLPVIKATDEQSVIRDGEHVALDWKLDPHAKPDIYYVNVPRRDGDIKLCTDQDEISFKTRYGENYDFIVLLNGKDSCFIRIAAIEEPTTISLRSPDSFPQTIPFTLNDSRVYLTGKINGQKEVTIQLDLGAGTSCVSSSSSEKLGLSFTEKTIISNTQGISEAGTCLNNELTIGNLKWDGVPLTEVGNMQHYEDLIIGNGIFREQIIEIDYDNKLLTIHDKLPAKAKDFHKQPVFYEQSRPKFKVDFIQNGKNYSFWFLFDTGRNGTMLIGEDFTGQDDNWSELKELSLFNRRKMVRLNAYIAGKEFKDIVTNAADPSKPAGRPTLFGNQILNKFNVILDNLNGFIYLKPNGMDDTDYFDYKKYSDEISKRNQ